MSKKRSNYQQIIKATSIYGGVQLVQILIQIIKSKFVAVLIGPSGMGIMGLFLSTIGLVTSLTNFGLETSAIKNVSEASASENQRKVSKTVTVLRKMVWVTGILGAIITLLFSSLLSKFTFGNNDYTFSFIWLSITLLFNQISTGQRVLMQGLRKINLLAKSSVWGSFVGLLVTVPFYYYLGIKGIVPVMIITSFITLLFSWYYSSTIKIERIIVSKKETYILGKGMLSMGIVISLSGVLSSIGAYFLRIYIGSIGGLDEVGLYIAGFTIINVYVGLIFTAMGTDYYPRLSAVNSNINNAISVINQQAHISILILAPILIVFILFIEIIIPLLYSNSFLGIATMLHISALAILFKAASWSISYIFLAKGESRLFFKNELLFNIVLLIFNLIGYKFFGLTGLGYSFLLAYIFYFLEMFIVSKRKYGFKFDKVFQKIFIIQLTLTSITLLSTLFFSNIYIYVIGGIMLFISSIFSLKYIDNMIGIKEWLSKRKK